LSHLPHTLTCWQQCQPATAAAASPQKAAPAQQQQQKSC
jgi:hypothetical protein